VARTTIHLSEALDSYRPSNGQELADLGRIRAALGTEDIFSRSSRLHVTASALVVPLPSRRVLLRWHTKMERWMQVGGHFDPGETDPRQVALREASEETGLSDLGFAKGTCDRPVQIVILPVPAHGNENAHEHADIRYVLVSNQPDRTRPESSAAKLRWMPFVTAGAEVGEENLRVFLARTSAMIESRHQPE
jgi:8-oxo-dGTP pyrophosphatase MutT (NUDIX family)